MSSSSSSFPLSLSPLPDNAREPLSEDSEYQVIAHVPDLSAASVGCATSSAADAGEAKASTEESTTGASSPAEDEFCKDPALPPRECGMHGNHHVDPASSRTPPKEAAGCVPVRPAEPAAQTSATAPETKRRGYIPWTHRLQPLRVDCVVSYLGAPYLVLERCHKNVRGEFTAVRIRIMVPTSAAGEKLSNEESQERIVQAYLLEPLPWPALGNRAFTGGADAASLKAGDLLQMRQKSSKPGAGYSFAVVVFTDPVCGSIGIHIDHEAVPRVFKSCVAVLDGWDLVANGSCLRSSGLTRFGYASMSAGYDELLLFRGPQRTCVGATLVHRGRRVLVVDEFRVQSEQLPCFVRVLPHRPDPAAPEPYWAPLRLCPHDGGDAWTWSNGFGLGACRECEHVGLKVPVGAAAFHLPRASSQCNADWKLCVLSVAALLGYAWVAWLHVSAHRERDALSLRVDAADAALRSVLEQTQGGALFSTLGAFLLEQATVVLRPVADAVLPVPELVWTLAFFTAYLSFFLFVLPRFAR